MRWQKGATMENNNIANYVNIFACVQFKSLSSILFAHYSNARSLWKGRSGLCCHVQNMSNALAFRQAVMSHCYRLVLHPGLRLTFIVTVELLKDQAGSDFVQYQIKMQAFVSRICSEFKQIELNWSKCFMETGPLYNPTMNKQISAPDTSQPSSQERWQVADLKHWKNSLYIFSLPRISTKDFPYIKGKIDGSIGINYSSFNFK